MTFLEEITDRIVKALAPDRIILFGSYDGTDRHASGDIDLLIVKNTDKRPIERRIEVEKVFSDRTHPLDVFVYTPDEIRRLYALGSPFIEEVMEKGRLLYMTKTTQNWIRDAREELEIARILFEHGKYRSVGYHA